MKTTWTDAATLPPQDKFAKKFRGLLLKGMFADKRGQETVLMDGRMAKNRELQIKRE